VGTILVVEDDDIEREMVSMRLVHAGHQVRAVATGRQALELVEAGGAPEVVVLDVGLPDMTGFELLPQLRAQHGCDHIPAIFLTGHDRGEEIIQGLHLKAAYITKPLIMSALFHAVHNALRPPGPDDR
jgi:DNA-binding response OmpR family regulator